MEDKKTVVVINGIQYDISEASPEAAGLIQDLVIVQRKLEDIKVEYDITTIAKNSLLEAIAGLIQSGNSGLVELKTEAQPTQDENSSEEGK